MKLNALHLFLILLGSLLLCSILGNPMVEGMSGMSGRKRKQSVSIDDSTNFEDDDITVNEYTTTFKPNDNSPKEATMNEDYNKINGSDENQSSSNTMYHSSDYNDHSNNKPHGDPHDGPPPHGPPPPPGPHKKNNGVPRSQIPPGDEDLYVLKSEIVPPVCPACPTLNCGDCKTQAPPCPPCARCPEPAFECKKVPNYKAAQTNPYLPRPWLNDFSQFGNHP